MKTFPLRLTAAICLAGAIYRAGTPVEVELAVARNLLARGKAELPEGVSLEDLKDYEAHQAANSRDDAERAEAAALARVLDRARKDQGMSADQWAALSEAKRKALLKQAAAAIAQEAKDA